MRRPQIYHDLGLRPSDQLQLARDDASGRVTLHFPMYRGAPSGDSVFNVVAACEHQQIRGTPLCCLHTHRV